MKRQGIKERGRLRTMLSVDIRRILHTKLIPIMAGISFLMPILILVMTSMMDGSVSVDPNTGAETVIEGFESVFEIIGTVSGTEAGEVSALSAMCNINLLYFLISVTVCLFVARDFQSGYVKHLFAVRPRRWDYVLSKTLTGTAYGVVFLLLFFLGALLGGAVASVPFTLVGTSVVHVAFCLLAKLMLVPLFVGIGVCASVFAREKSWLSVLLSLAVGMLLFMAVPQLTPLNAELTQVVICLLLGASLALGFGFAGTLLLEKTDILK